MRGKDIIELHRLMTLKQQAASLEYKQRQTEQTELTERADEMVRDSYDPALQGSNEAQSGGEMHAANQYRRYLRQQAALLHTAATSLQPMIDKHQGFARDAAMRENATKVLVDKLQMELRAEKNQRDENAREQQVILKRHN